jgi:hypothetical protein
MRKIAIWILGLSFCFSGVNCKKNKEAYLIEYILYEYGMPLQKSPDGFDIKFIAKIDNNGKAEIKGRIKGKYKTITGQISKELLSDIKSLESNVSGINKHLIEEKRKKFLYSTDGYSYVKFRGQEICFMPQFMSRHFNAVIRNLNIELGKTFDRKDLLKEIDLKVSNYKNMIVPLHKVSNLPLLRIPPAKIPLEGK